MTSIAFATHRTTAAHGFMQASLSSSSKTCACAFGSSSVAVRRPGGVVDLDDTGRRRCSKPPRAYCDVSSATRQLSGRHGSARPELHRDRADPQLTFASSRWRGTPQTATRELLRLGLVTVGELDHRHEPPPPRKRHAEEVLPKQPSRRSRSGRTPGAGHRPDTRGCRAPRRSPGRPPNHALTPPSWRTSSAVVQRADAEGARHAGGGAGRYRDRLRARGRGPAVGADARRSVHQGGRRSSRDGPGAGRPRPAGPDLGPPELRRVVGGVRAGARSPRSRPTRSAPCSATSTSGRR